MSGIPEDANYFVKRECIQCTRLIAHDDLVQTPEGDLHECCVEDYEEETGEKIERDPEPIEDVLRRIASQVPEEEWGKLPEDLTDNLDHYLYGTDKDK